MKISAVQLATAIGRLKSTINGYGKSNDDLVIDIEFTTADPGSGQMVDTMVISAAGNVDDDKEDKIRSMTIELYPAIEKQEPRATKTEVFKVRNSYG